MTSPTDKDAAFETEGDPDSLVGYFDVLGASELARKGQFGRATAFDFVNPAGIAARFYPKIRAAAFSDSVLVSANKTDAGQFLDSVAFMHRHWFADGIAVRGGIAYGEIDWAHPVGMDRSLNASNFLYARVYGRAVVEAVRIEQRAGPGALCTVSDAASAILRGVEATSILSAQASYLVWTSRRGVAFHAHYFALLMRDNAPDSDAWRHARATHWYFRELHRQKHALERRIPATVVEPDEWDDLREPST